METKGSKVIAAAQTEALTRPVLGGNGPDAARQAQLERELAVAGTKAEADALLNQGLISPEQYKKRFGI